MAESPSYTTVPGKIPELLKKIRDTGIPPKATIAWLQALGFKSTNDRSLLNVLRQIRFVDSSGIPQQVWKDYRGANSKEVLGSALKLGYQDLYQTYPDAHSCPPTDIGHVFSTQTSAGKQVIDKMVSTFRSLASQAEFTESPSAASAPQVIAGDNNVSAAPIAEAAIAPAPGALNVNINVQLTLPETSDQKVFDAFFKAMRKHLLDSEIP